METQSSISMDPVITFVEHRLKNPITLDHDIFDAGLSSMFAMELVVFLEHTYSISIVGNDMRIDNFRTIDTMSRLIVRLQAAPSE